MLSGVGVIQLLPSLGYLPAARQQAADRLHALVRAEAPSAAIAHARTELAYVRHPKGPVYQSHL
ncbi:hypothetical protein ASG20_18515 [Sphingomonas sp. Leaf198]|nr:hypothetical protein ASG20_18515 [Sphingomonas sp. Leaf198]